MSQENARLDPASQPIQQAMKGDPQVGSQKPNLMSTQVMISTMRKYVDNLNESIANDEKRLAALQRDLRDTERSLEEQYKLRNAAQQFVSTI